MGQYGNQPDFGTRAATATINGTPDNASTAVNLGSAALYIGTGGDLVCRVVGGNAQFGTGSQPENGYTIFRNIPSGTFFPVIVNAVWASNGGSTTTSCSNIIALY